MDPMVFYTDILFYVFKCKSDVKVRTSPTPLWEGSGTGHVARLFFKGTFFSVETALSWDQSFGLHQQQYPHWH